MDIVHPQIDKYLNSLLQERHAKLHEMEAFAKERDFPIVGPLVGRLLFQYVKITGAKRVLELGSGFGYSAAWIASALPQDGNLICTEASQNLVDLAEDYLKVLGVLDKVRLHNGDAVKYLRQATGPFDLIFNDVDKEQYPEVEELAYDRLKTGGLLISDNALFHGRILAERPDNNAKGILQYNETVHIPERWWTTILPLRDGLAVSIKVD